MAISISRYVDITSGVGGGAGVRQRDLVGRLFTTDTRVPIDSLVEVESADDALLYFGASSQEYARAAFYFGWISKAITKARKLQFARWADVAAAPRVFGAKPIATLSQFQSITAGTLTMTAGDTTANLTALNFASATSLANVATTLQTALRAAAGAQFATSTVTFDAVAGTFNFVGAVAGSAPISVVSDDLSQKLGWGPNAVFSPGSAAQTIVEALNLSAEASSNFGSFAFIPAITSQQVVDAATWNAARNVEYIYSARVDDASYVTLGAALLGTSGVSLTYAPVLTQFDEMVPMMVMAATDYSRRNSVQNYMYQQFGSLNPKVTTNAMAAALDDLRVNYYGVTQTAGQQIAFYQRGVMGGSATSPVDQNIYANEIWLKDAARANIMTLLLSQGRVPANASGETQIIAVLQDVIDRALFNGAISVDKPLTIQQKLYITDVTGDELAWYQVQSTGYWVSADMQSYVTIDGRTEWKCVYTLIYSKDDSIRKVEGTHVLI